MQNRLIFVISPPRSGSTLLQRMLASHSEIFTHPEPHLMTPLAYLGYYDTVEKAPYDHINAAQAMRDFVGELPRGERDYLDALRAYSDTLYGRMLASSEKPKAYFLDKTPAYALVLGFLSKVYPDAKYIVLTRHPIAVMSSYANSFFGGDWGEARRFNPVVERYVPAISKFLQDKQVSFHHVSYEALVASPEMELEKIFSFLELAHEADAANYGAKFTGKKEGMGDPMGVAKHSRPVTDSVHAWAKELLSDDKKLHLARDIAARLVPSDLLAWGNPVETFWDPLDDAERAKQVENPNAKRTFGLSKGRKKRWNSYGFKRRLLMSLRKDIHHRPLGRVVQRVRYYCDVILRDTL